MKRDILHESAVVDMSDDALKELLGATWEAIKNLTDQMKTDPEVERMEGELKKYKKDNFQDAIKRYKRLLKAARYVAQARGIQWKIPEELK